MHCMTRCLHGAEQLQQPQQQQAEAPNSMDTSGEGDGAGANSGAASPTLGFASHRGFEPGVNSDSRKTKRAGVQVSEDSEMKEQTGQVKRSWGRS